ncbi:SET and MYND domain-containing protein 4-like [Ceratina calcarata]|uniref:Protein-lysine N-methyltransferase SMYD4 n=1 Tax=Ceratina calcarata TaxID=156304 RepID=A0AAJ7NES7_9HYME|nr:SET and MYND domain-containing protein 4-like [Ceratina calcarata]
MQWQNVLEFVSVKRSTSTPKEEANREDELMSRLWDDKIIKQSVNWWLDDVHRKRKQSKSVVKAETFKNLGNKMFQAKRYIKSIEFYTKSASYAPLDSSQLSIAFANRSASLFYLYRYDECIRDAKLAIKFNYPKQLHYKLYLRTIQCYLKLGKSCSAEEMLSKLEEIINDPDYVKPSMKSSIEQKMREVKLVEPTCAENVLENDSSLSKARSEFLFKENPVFLGASECVDVKYDEEVGRHVVANRFIKRGDILFVEKPVSFVFRDDTVVNDLCQHCSCVTTDIPVPCTTCLNAFYCNEKCLSEAWSSYHRWECPGFQMGLWRDIGIGHLALKVLLTCTTTTDRVRFNDVQNLCTNFNESSMGDLTLYGTTAIMLTIYLSEYTNYFEVNDIEDSLMTKFSDRSFNSNFDTSTDANRRLYISCLLLRHILQLISNGHAIPRSDALLNTSDFSTDDDIVATGIYPSASMMNHSCDPNIINIFVDQHLIVRASRDIAHGKEIFNCYGPHYRYLATEDRQKHLKSQYSFTCKCHACVQPKWRWFTERFSGMRCSKCNGALCDINDFIYCLDCGNRSCSNLLKKVVFTESMFREAQLLFDSGKLEDALSKLNECLKLQRAVLYKYNENITASLNLMAKMYKTSERWVDSIECLKDSLPAVTERFGFCSWELLNQLNDLTDVSFSFLEKEARTNTDTYKYILQIAEFHLRKMERIAYHICGTWSKVYRDIEAKQRQISLLKEA